MKILGIDIGKNGGLAILNEDSSIDSIFSMPKEPYDLATLIINCKVCSLIAVFEKQQAFPKQGVVSTFTLGYEYGLLKGLLIAYKIPHLEIRPQEWKKHFGLLRKDKKASIEVAKGLYPDWAEKITNDGIADAILIARYYLEKKGA